MCIRDRLSDSKGVFDSLNNELPQDDKKSAVEMPIIEELLQRMNGRSRWIPHNVNPSDGLTKLKGAHMQPLMDLLQSGCYHLKTEEVNLAERAAQKETQGRAARQKVSGRSLSENRPHQVHTKEVYVSRTYLKVLERAFEDLMGHLNARP